MRAVVAGLADLELGREVSLADAKARPRPQIAECRRFSIRFAESAVVDLEALKSLV